FGDCRQAKQSRLPFGGGPAGYAPEMTRRPSMASRARWLLAARPGDYMLALSVATASLPVVGKRLEPLGGITAMGVWGYRHMPDFLSTSAKSWLTPRNAEARKAERDMTPAVLDAALRGIVSG